MAGGEDEFKLLKERIDLGFVSFKLKVGTNDVTKDIERAYELKRFLITTTPFLLMPIRVLIEKMH